MKTHRDNASVKLDPVKSKDKAYFDRMLRIFKGEVLKSGIMEELRLKRRFLGTGQLIKEKKKHNKWKFYRA